MVPPYFFPEWRWFTIGRVAKRLPILQIATASVNLYVNGA